MKRSTIYNNLIGIDGLACLLADEEHLKQGLHFENPRRTTDKNDLVNVTLVNATAR